MLMLEREICEFSLPPKHNGKTEEIMSNKIIALALALSVYAATVSTYLLADSFFTAQSKERAEMCKKQDLMSEFDCLNG